MAALVGGGPRQPPAVKMARHTSPIDLTKAPVRIPKTAAKIEKEPELLPQEMSFGLVEGIPGGVPRGSRDGLWNSIVIGSPPSSPQPKTTKTTRIKVGGQVEAAKLIFQPKPEYPPLAKMARIQGTVRLEAVMSRDGTIEDLKVLSGHPLLVKVALEAVSRWRYQPTLLNGEPVEVLTEIGVNFYLAE